MKYTKNNFILLVVLPTVLVGTVLSGCGNKASNTPAPYAGGKNPAAVAPAPGLANPAAAPATGGPPEAERYRQMGGPGAKAPGAR